MQELKGMKKDQVKEMRMAFDSMAEFAKSGAAGTLTTTFDSIIKNQPVFQIMNEIVGMIGMEATKETIGATKGLLETLQNPEVQEGISDLGSAVGDLIEPVLGLVNAMGDLETTIGDGETAVKINALGEAMQFLGMAIGGIPTIVHGLGNKIEKLGEATGAAKETVIALKGALMVLSSLLGGPLGWIMSLQELGEEMDIQGGDLADDLWGAGPIIDLPTTGGGDSGGGGGGEEDERERLPPEADKLGE